MKHASDFHASDLLGQSGPFCKQIAGYQVRDNQLALCDAIDDAIEAGNVLAAEAGTGIGKTFAYLVPSLLSGKKVITGADMRDGLENFKLLHWIT